MNQVARDPLPRTVLQDSFTRHIAGQPLARTCPFDHVTEVAGNRGLACSLRGSQRSRLHPARKTAPHLIREPMDAGDLVSVAVPGVHVDGVVL